MFNYGKVIRSAEEAEREGQFMDWVQESVSKFMKLGEFVNLITSISDGDAATCVTETYSTAIAQLKEAIYQGEALVEEFWDELERLDQMWAPERLDAEYEVSGYFEDRMRVKAFNTAFQTMFEAVCNIYNMSEVQYLLTYNEKKSLYEYILDMRGAKPGNVRISNYSDEMEFLQLVFMRLEHLCAACKSGLLEEKVA